MRHLLLLLLLLSLAFDCARADQATAVTTTNSLVSGAPNISHDTSPVAVPEPSAKALSFYHSGNVLWAVSALWQFLVPALFLLTGLSARIRIWAQVRGKKSYFIFALYFSVFILLSFLINLPLDYYAGFVRPHHYDLSNQTFGKWLGDSLKFCLVNLVGGLATLWFLFWLIRKSPRHWWLITALLAVPYLCVVMLIWPLMIDPLFNKFQPMQDKALEAKILAQAARAGIEGSRVYEVNKSVDTKALDAYVTGFMGSKRIVIWDNTLHTLNEDELLFVVGHEMGHYVLNHIIKDILVDSLSALLSLYVVHRLGSLFIRRYRVRFGFDSLSDFAALPLIFLLMSLVSFITSPVYLAYSRHHEHEADRFGLELTHNNHAAATAFLKLQATNLSNPRPDGWYVLWRSSHPPIGDRIDFCNTYRPWETNGPSRYDALFKP
jgi:Zn-dependent protease with chaperone function